MSASRTVAVAFLAALAMATLSVQPALGRRTVIGHSVQGRPIVAWVYGPSSAPRKVLLIGVIHGNEQAGLAITNAERQLRPPRGRPGMDSSGTQSRRRGRGHPTERARSRPEPKLPVPVAVLERPDLLFRTAAGIRAGDAGNDAPRAASPSGPHSHLSPTHGPGRRVRWGSWRCAPLCAGCRHARHLPTFLPGEETAWSNHTLPGTTSFVVELPAGRLGPAALKRQLRAVRAIELGQRAGSPARCDSSTVAL